MLAVNPHGRHAHAADEGEERLGVVVQGLGLVRGEGAEPPEGPAAVQEGAKRAGYRTSEKGPRSWF